MDDATKKPDGMVSVRDVTKTFREGRGSLEVLKGADLSIARGEILALEGPSGSGKTTLLSIIGCLLSATSGHVSVAGEVVSGASERRRQAIRKRHVGFVFQQFNLFPALSALENVEYAMNLKGFEGRDARRGASELVERVGLADRAHALPRDMSGGEKQRVAIARALVGSPSVVLADEPTANLDAVVAEHVLDLFADIARQQQRSLLIVTHDPKIRRIADRVVRIEGGRIAA